jgi:hypothetical protein
MLINIERYGNTYSSDITTIALGLRTPFKEKSKITIHCVWWWLHLGS